MKSQVKHLLRKTCVGQVKAGPRFPKGDRQVSLTVINLRSSLWTLTYSTNLFGFQKEIGECWRLRADRKTHQKPLRKNTVDGTIFLQELPSWTDISLGAAHDDSTDQFPSRQALPMENHNILVSASLGLFSVIYWIRNNFPILCYVLLESYDP